MIDNMNKRAELIIDALNGLSTFKALGLLVSIITFFTVKNNAKV